MEVSTTQAAALIGKSERTIQRYIKDGTLNARKLAEGKYVVNVADLESLRGDQADIEALRMEVEALKQRVTELEATVQALNSSPGMKPYEVKTAPVRILREGPVPGLVKGLDFAAQHHVTEDAARAAFKRQKITTTKLEGQQSHYLTRDQQRQAVAYWQSHGTPNFELCNDPACVCQESKQM